MSGSRGVGGGTGKEGRRPNARLHTATESDANDRRKAKGYKLNKAGRWAKTPPNLKPKPKTIQRFSILSRTARQAATPPPFELLQASVPCFIATAAVSFPKTQQRWQHVQQAQWQRWVRLGDGSVSLLACGRGGAARAVSRCSTPHPRAASRLAWRRPHSCSTAAWLDPFMSFSHPGASPAYSATPAVDTSRPCPRCSRIEPADEQGRQQGNCMQHRHLLAVSGGKRHKQQAQNLTSLPFPPLAATVLTVLSR